MFADEQARLLFEHGHGALAARFDAGAGLVRAEVADAHDLRDSLWYALCLLLAPPADVPAAESIIRKVLIAQETRDASPHRGNWRWFYEDADVQDLNAAQFVVERLVHILLRGGDRLSAGLRDSVFASMRLAFQEAARLDVHWTYTNIYLLDVHNSILAGELLRDDRLVQRGVTRLREWAGRTSAAGAPHEFNSPTYSAVQINALAAVAQHARETEARSLALEMEGLLWRHVASHWHAPTRQLAGPHSRAYRRDVTGSVGFLKVLLYRLLGDERLLAPTPYYAGPGREEDVLTALTEYHCPPDARRMLGETAEREVRETPSREPLIDTVTYLCPEFALGTMSAVYAVGEPPEAWPQHDSCSLYYRRGEGGANTCPYGVLYCRYLFNDRRIGQYEREVPGSPVDLWDEGVFRSAQRGPHAVVVYGMSPVGFRRITGARLDVRLLGPDAGSAVLTASGPFSGGEMELPAGRPLVIADGEVYIGLIPLAPDHLTPDTPGVVLWRDGQETVLSLYNYRGPAANFWEYRSLAGPFFKGNVRNGFAVSVAARSAFADAATFLEMLSGLTIEDVTVGPVRRIHFAGVNLDYDLRDLKP